MRVPSGSTDRKIAFVAVDSTDLKTRETGLSSFTVYRSRNGGTATAYTTPTVAELSAANMPGVYVLTIDEDTTLDSGHDTEEYVVHITQASMAPVTRALELYRPETTEGRTLALETDGHGHADLKEWLGVAPLALASQRVVSDIGAISGDATAADNLESYTDGTTPQPVNATQISGDATAADNLEAAADGTGFNLGAGQIVAASVTAAVTVGTNNDKTGYALTTADKLAILTAASGTADSGSTTTIVDAERTEADTDYWKDSFVLITSGSTVGQIRRITAFDPSTDTITVERAFTQAISTNTYVILRSAAHEAAAAGGGPSAGDIADAVWDEARSGHTTAGSFGQGVASVQGNVTGSVASVTGNVDGNVTGSVGSLATQAKADVNAEVDGALDTAIPGSPTANSINERIRTLDDADLPGKVGTPANLGGGATIAQNLSDIEAQTDDIGAAGAGLTALGDARLANLDAAISSRATPAQVNAEVVDALVTDTYAEPATVPAATSSIKDRLGWLFMLGRNKRLTTGSQDKVRNDADSADIGTSAISDDGTTFTRSEYA